MSSEYQIQQSIGIGSFGQVFLAIKKKTKQTCVIKKIKIRDISEIQKKNIQNEVKLLQDLQHINIVGYKDSFMDKEGFLNIVMQNCEGGDMYQKIRNTNGKRFEENQIIDWFIQICLALHYMHQKRILHRDLKTQNIFLTGGRVRLGDFGISKVLDEKQQLTNTVIGTPYYMSPEQFRFKPYNYKTDIWALGCLLYEMCNLRHAFDAQNLSALSVKVLKGNYPPVNSQYSKPLRELIGKLLSINYKDRPTIVQILKMPFLRKRLAIYIQSCIKQQNNKDNHIQTLIQQAKILGLQFVETVPTQIENEYQIRTERGEQPQPGSSKILRKNSRQILDKKALDDRKRIIQKQLQREQKQKGKLQTKYKKEQYRIRADRRQQILEKDKERRKKIMSQEKLKSDSSPNLLHLKSKKQSVDLSKYNSQLVQQSKSIPIKHVPLEEQFYSASHQSKIIPYSSVPSSNCKEKQKAFKMQQDYDMNFEAEEEPEQEKHQTIYQILEMQEDEPPQKPKHSIIPSEIEQVPPQESIEITDVMNIVNAVKEQLKTKTQKIDSLKSELLQINFEISEDSIHDIPKIINQKYQKIQQNISTLQERIQVQIGNNKYQLLYKLLRQQKENMSPNEHQRLKESVIGIIGKGNLGYWHLADQIILLQESLKLIPQYR